MNPIILCHAAKCSFFHLSASESWIFLYALLHWHSFHLISRLNCATTKHTACLVQSTQKHLLVSMQYIKHNHLIYTIENQTPKNHMQKLAGSTFQQMHLHSCTWTHITSLKNERHSETSSILTGRSTKPDVPSILALEVWGRCKVPRAAKLHTAWIFKWNSTCKVWLRDKMYTMWNDCCSCWCVHFYFSHVIDTCICQW